MKQTEKELALAKLTFQQKKGHCRMSEKTERLEKTPMSPKR